MSKKEKLAAFKARLKKKNVTDGAFRKYVAEYSNLLFYRQHQEAQLSSHAQHIKMAELRDENNLRILNIYQLMQRLASGQKVNLMIYPEVDKQLNLVGNYRVGKYRNDLPPVEFPNRKKSLQPIGKITVWQEPLKDENEIDRPNLTLEQIITQIPQGLVDRTKAVCLLSEEQSLFEDAYDMYMGCYQFKNIWLFG